MSRVTRLAKMNMSSTSPEAPTLSPSPSPTPTTPLEISQQLQRVELLHQQLKAEAQRAQEFLAKLHHGDSDSISHIHPAAEDRQNHPHHHSHGQTHHHRHHHHHHHNHQHTATHHKNNYYNHRPDYDRDDPHRRVAADEWELTPDPDRCTCSRTHRLAPPASRSTHASTHTSTGSSTSRSMNNRNVPTADPGAGSASGPPAAPLGFGPRVDEREVRDLEKRVRGLEGRVRGFEGLPPDRELALLEVERLRRELEGLALRREGLFEGLGYEDAVRLGKGTGDTVTQRNALLATSSSSGGGGGGAGATATGRGDGAEGRGKKVSGSGKTGRTNAKGGKKN